MKIKEFFEQLRMSDVELLKNEVYYLYYRILLCEPFRAHELHSKYFEWIDLKRIEFLISEMEKNPMFNSLEVILFMYRSLLSQFSSNYLGEEFRDVAKFFSLSFKEIDTGYHMLVQELEKEMNRIGEKEKFAILKTFKKLYIRKLDKAEAEEYSMEVESDEGNEERND